MARLLLVDDDPDQLQVRKLVLEQVGHEAFTAATPGAALDQFVKQRPKLVITDLRLPKAEDGLGLIRAMKEHDPGARILLLTGWGTDLNGRPEAGLIEQVMMKPVRSQRLVEWIAKFAMLLVLPLSLAAQSEKVFPLQLDGSAEVVAELDIVAPSADWGRAGREGVLATITIDESKKIHQMVFGGSDRLKYPVFLGELAAGAHTVKVERHLDYSARGVQLQIHDVKFRQLKATDADYAVVANAPVIHARANTIGKFTDVPLMAYAEKLGDGSIQYTVIFSNEDGGTSTRALMARWGRVTDIEYVYQVWPDKAGRPVRAQIQTRNHKDVPYMGKREAHHPLLTVVTDNNMVSEDAPTAVRYQPAPVVVEMGQASREKVMDEHPFTYLISSRELEREGKLRSFGTVEGTKISAPENYLVVEMRVTNKDARVATLVKIGEDNFYRSSNIHIYDMGIERNGWVRTAIELPPATQGTQVAEIGFECLPDPKATTAGTCRVDAIGKMFFLNARQQPDANFWRPRLADRSPWTIPGGQTRIISMR
jgi:CheY-like chemotaxis protein